MTDSSPAPEHRKKVLFLSHTFPHPPDGGVWIRTYNIMRELARTFDVTVLCFERQGSVRPTRDLEASLEHLRSFLDIELFPVPQYRSRAVYVFNHLRSLLTRRVYTRFLYRSDAFRRRLRELLDTGDFDLVHVDSLDLSDYLDCIEGVPVACTHHNVESALLRRRAQAVGALPGAYIRMQADLMEAEERRWCPRVDLNVMCSSIDAELLQEVAPGSRCHVAPNGVDIEEFRPGAPGAADADGAAEGEGAPDVDGGDDGGDPPEESGAVYVGGTSWFPNLDALEYFAEDILPRIREDHPEFPVKWVGFSTPEQQAAFGRHGIELTGYVDDVRPYVHRAASFIVPLRVGGGTRLKIVMAWAMGAAVISTSVGCEGLAAEDGVNIIVRDTPAELAEAVMEVEQDPELRRRLGEAARKAAEEIYAWPVIGRELAGVYRELIEKA